MKKLLILLIALLGFTFTLTAQESSTFEVKKERMPMYIGASMGLDSYSPCEFYRVSTFAIEPRFGFSPFKNKQMNIEINLRFATKSTNTVDKNKFEDTNFGMSAKYLYNFKPIEKFPKLNFYAGGGIGFLVNHCTESFETVYAHKSKDIVIYKFQLPVCAGAKYQISNKLEGVAQMELGLGSMMEFSILAGINYKF